MARFAQQRKNAGAPSRELSLTNIVTGDVSQHGNNFLLHVQLADAETEALLWAQTYRQPAAEMIQQPQAIAADIADALQVRLSPAKEVSRHSHNSQAYQLYLKGRHQWKKRTEESLKKAVSLFQDALEIDPMYSLAYAGLADTYTLLGATGYKSAIQHDCMRKAKAAAMKALEIDPNVAEAHASLAFVSFRFDWNWQEAERQFVAAIEINPNYVTAHHWFAIFLSAIGRHSEALCHVRMAQDLDPLSTIVNAAAGRVHYFARNYECALNIYKTALETEPHFAQCHFDAGMVYLQLNCIDNAIAEFQQAAALSGRSLTLALLGVSYARAHRRNDALELLDGRAPDEQALVYTALGERQCALRCLEDAYREHAGSLAYMKVEPLWDALRTEPRFDDFLRRMQLLP
jgi:tetratricopeptide (TPR) repeat protein